MNLDNSATLKNKSNLNSGHDLKSIADIGMQDVNQALDTVKGYANSATSFVKRNPVAVILSAVAIGGVIALALSMTAKGATSVAKKASI